MKISELVSNYIKNEKYYKSAKYNETQLRTDFLDPLFESLGWDIKNANGKITHEREVLVEEGLKASVNSTTKKPDYTFRLFSERKYFLEAKKPSVDISSDANPAKQIRRYGFTAKLKISVLSNFEYLAIYDCSTPVKENDHVNNSRINIYHYTEYEEKFDEIAEQLSRESVYSGNFDEYWKTIEEQINKFSIDNLFLEQINEWRLNLAHNFISIHPEIDEIEINDLTQRYINSIVFLRVCEDRNLEEYETLLSLAEKDNYQSLISKLKEADKKYNSGLFELQYMEDFISDKNLYIWTIIRNLYFPESTYSFSVFSSDILGNIYETFLGEKVCLESGTPTLKPKPENEDRDIVTTPIHIIKDILIKTVSKYSNGKNAEQLLASKIADIACGSGAFLLETYQLLHDLLVDYYTLHDKSKLVEMAHNSFRLSFDIKRALLQNCIFGVDKDYNAVQAAKFGLLLKLLESEDNDTITIPVLPELNENIIFGNSLLDSSMVENKDIDVVNPFDFANQKFDIVVGNPPYLATEHMKKITPVEYKLYKGNYTSAYKQYDKYFLFIERALTLLSQDGYLGYILPSKFMKVGAGKKLREVLLDKCAVSEITSFGANQIFKDKTTYTCLLIARKNNDADKFSYNEINSISDWKVRKTDAKNSDIVNLNSLTSDTWTLMPSLLKPIYKKITDSSITLKNLLGSNNINNGIQTSANPVYIHIAINEDDTYLYFKKNDKEWKIEKELTRPYYKTSKGKDKLHTHRKFSANSFVIYPYRKIKNCIEFVECKELKNDYPYLYEYLLAQKDRLIKRDVKPVPKTQDEWYRFGRHQSLDKCAVPAKIVNGVLSQGNKYAIDYSGALVSSGGTAGYCMITIPDDSPYSIYYIQAVLDSKYCEWFASLFGEIFRGGYIARGTKVLNELPVIPIDFSNKNSKKIHDDISKTQKSLINSFTLMSELNNQPRKLVPVQRKYDKLKANMDDLLAKLFDLGKQDDLIPIIADIYK